MATEALPTRTDLCLLCRVQLRDAEGRAVECLGNILELGPRGARLESALTLETGGHLVLQVVLPGQRKYERPQVTLHCVVRKAHEEPSLHYDLELTVLDKEAHERLNLYLRRDATGRVGS